MKIYDEIIMECLRKQRGLNENDTCEDSAIMGMSKQDAFNEYCEWNGLSSGYELINVIEYIYGINLQQ